MNGVTTSGTETGEVKTYALCPVSGVGKPPEDWSHCVGKCSIYDVTTGHCSLNALWHLRELPSIAQDASAAVDALCCL